MSTQEKEFRKTLSKAQKEKDFMKSFLRLRRYLDRLEDKALAKAIEEGRRSDYVSEKEIKEILNS